MNYTKFIIAQSLQLYIYKHIYEYMKNICVIKCNK